MTIIEYKNIEDPRVEESRSSHQKAIAHKNKKDPQTLEEAEAIFYKNGLVDDGNLGTFPPTIVKKDNLTIVSHENSKKDI